jgi:hypothetical protein
MSSVSSSVGGAFFASGGIGRQADLIDGPPDTTRSGDVDVDLGVTEGAAGFDEFFGPESSGMAGAVRQRAVIAAGEHDQYSSHGLPP